MEKQTIDISAGTIWRFVLISMLLAFLFFIRDVLLILFISIILLSAAQPIVEKMEAKKIPRFLGAALIYIVFFCFLFLFGYLVIPIVAMEVSDLAKNIPQYLEGIDNFLKDLSALAVGYNLDADLQGILENYSSRISDVIPAIFSNTFSFLGGLFKVLIVMSLSFYMLVKKNGTKSFIKTITPKKNQAYVLDLTERIQRKMGRWLIGQFVMILIIFSLDYLVLFFLDVPYAVVLALLGGLLEIIPYIGPTLAIVPAVLFGLTVSPLTALLVFLFYLLIQQLENYVITPLVMRKAVGLNPVIIILSLLIGGKLAGILGVIIAVPFATALSVFVGDVLNGNGKDELKN
jgi:predicted PurR-regulated permease PerM